MSKAASCCSLSCCGGCTGWLVFWIAYWAWHSFAVSTAIWHFLEPRIPECADRETTLPANNSGVRVLVYGLSKTGTKTMARSLQKLGLAHSYHSEELSLYVWSRLADDFWLRPENGGRRAGTSSGVYLGFGRPAENLNLFYSNDTKVLQSLSLEKLARYLAGCRVDATTFDGMERLFWPIYEVSPDAKVVILDWRTFGEYTNSRENFGPWLFLSYFGNGMMKAAFSGLPWILLSKPIDTLFGSPGQKLMLSGMPEISSNIGLAESFFLLPTGPRRMVTHLYAGLKVFIPDMEAYRDFYHIAYDRIPKERRMSWDMRKHGWEDLCAFLDVPPKDCPGTGSLTRQSWDYVEKKESPVDDTLAVLIYILLHLVNAYVFRAGLTAHAGLLRGAWRSCCGQRAGC